MDFSPRGAPPRTRVGWFLLSIRICVIVSGCIVHVSVCIQAHVPNHYVTTRYRSIHVRYIAIQRIGRPPPHLQTRYTDIAISGRRGRRLPIAHRRVEGRLAHRRRWLRSRLGQRSQPLTRCTAAARRHAPCSMRGSTDRSASDAK